MSVVNRMLQDIDRRLGSAAVGPLGAPEGIRAVPSPAAPPRSRRTGWIAAVSVCLVAAAAVISGRWQAPPTPIAMPTRAVIVAEALALDPIEGEPAPTVEIAPAPAIEVAHFAKAARSVARSSPEVLKLSLQLSAPVSEAPRARVAKSEAAATSGVAVRQVAAEETVQAARALWSEGAHAAAIATLREALAAAEPSRNPAAAAMLARELARLETAANRPQAAVDLLRRLEPFLGDDADAWALRGNAEQRLALHAQAAASYLAALRLRPAEGRWMLGAAISLAAVGELAAAQAWVDQARERGALTPPIAAYLRQLGIATRQ